MAMNVGDRIHVSRAVEAKVLAEAQKGVLCLRKIGTNMSFGWTPALSERPDMVPITLDIHMKLIELRARAGKARAANAHDNARQELIKILSEKQTQADRDESDIQAEIAAETAEANRTAEEIKEFENGPEIPEKVEVPEPETEPERLATIPPKPAVEQIPLEEMNSAELSATCEKLGLAIGGKKSEKLERINEALASAAAKDSAE